jgi:hypothetical protein
MSLGQRTANDALDIPSVCGAIDRQSPLTGIQLPADDMKAKCIKPGEVIRGATTIPGS